MRVRRDVADGEHAGFFRFRRRRIGDHAAQLNLRPPIGDRAEIVGQAEKRQQDISFQRSAVGAVERRDLHRRQLSAIADKPAELIGHDHFDRSRFRKRAQLGFAIGGGAKFRAAMNDLNRCGEFAERNRPIDG